VCCSLKMGCWGSGVSHRREVDPDIGLTAANSTVTTFAWFVDFFMADSFAMIRGRKKSILAILGGHGQVSEEG